MKLYSDKCTFFQHKISILGHLCKDKGIKPDNSNFIVVQNHPKPEDAESIKCFAAFCNYYRRFIRFFAHYAPCLTNLTKKNTPFVWTPECEKSFNYLRNLLVNAPVLKYPNFKKQFCIATDASKVAAGTILSQEYDAFEIGY